MWEWVLSMFHPGESLTNLEKRAVCSFCEGFAGIYTSIEFPQIKIRMIIIQSFVIIPTLIACFVDIIAYFKRHRKKYTSNFILIDRGDSNRCLQCMILWRWKCSRNDTALKRSSNRGLLFFFFKCIVDS